MSIHFIDLIELLLQDAAEELREALPAENVKTPADLVQELRRLGWPLGILSPVGMLHLATRLREDGEKELAQEVTTHALEAYSQPPEFINEQGHLHYAFKKYDQALDWFQKTINDDAANNAVRSDAFTGAGASLRRLRRFDEAAEMFQQALDAAGGIPSATLLRERGWLAFYQEYYEQAFASFRQALPELTESEQHDALVGLLASRRQLDLLSPYSEYNAKQLVSDWRTAGLSPQEIIKIFIDCSSNVLEYLNLYPAALANAEHLLEFAGDDDTGKKQGLYFKIAALKWLRRYAEAEHTYRQAPERFQTDDEIWNEMANSYYEQKRYREAYLRYSGKVLDRPELTPAERELKQRLKSNPDAREWTIVSLRKMHRLDEAKREANAALTFFGPKLNFLSELAAIYYAERDYETAIKFFKRVLASDDYDTFASQWLTASFRKQDKIPEAQQTLDAAMKKVPYETRLWDECGWLAFDQGKFEDAIKAFDRAGELDPYLINKQFAKAETLLRLNRSDDALEVYEKLDKRFPGDAEVGEQLCLIYTKLGQMDLAKERQISLRQMHPNSALGLNALGGYELAQNNFAAAEKAFRDAIVKADYEPQYYVNLAWALVRQLKPAGEVPPSETDKEAALIDEAKENCRRALKLDPFIAKAYGCLGVIAIKQDAFLDAEFYFRKSIEASPGEGFYVELGSLYCQMACYDKATETLGKALQITPNDGRAYIELGNVAASQDDNKQAIKYCREATFIDPKTPDTHRALAVALMRADQYDEAELVVRKAIRTLGPAKPWRLYLLLAQILVHNGDNDNKDRKKKNLELYEEAVRYINEARKSHAPNADILFHSGIVQHRLEEFATSQKNFAECLKLDRDRFDAERNGRLVQATIEQQRQLFTVNKFFSYFLAVTCFVMLGVLWAAYFAGYQRVERTFPAANSTASATPPKAEFTVDKPLLNVMTPILLGLLTIAALLPNLSKLKLPGFEAEIVEPKTAPPDISTGPRGDIGFGSSLPIIDPEPR